MVVKIAIALATMSLFGKYLVIPQARRIQTASRRPALGYAGLVLITMAAVGLLTVPLVPVSAMEIAGGVTIVFAVAGAVLVFLAGERHPG
ncbi:MAG: hypothetical protein JXA67_18690 [Micromonosporaceae bacterium]|nr:hypothetical protein [Micromonosporaceae bacterium]